MAQFSVKGTHFPKSIILQAAFWYLRYSLSYRDIEELMAERGIEVDHATIQRWVVKYTPILEAKLRKRKTNIGTSGVWTRPILRSKANGITCAGP